MLEQQAAIGQFVENPAAVHRPLQVPARHVIHGAGSEAGMRVHEFVVHVIEITSRVRPPRRLGRNRNVINEADLQRMSPSERRQLARSLAALDYPHPLHELRTGRRLGILFSLVACIVLAGWIVVLVMTLHKHFTATHWRLAWVGFDIVLLIGFAATGWAFWRGRQIVIACLLVTGALLCCDAWFDVILDLGTSGEWLSLLSAVAVELPIAFLMFAAARRLIRLSAVVAVGDSGDEQVPSLWRMPLVGNNASQLQ